MTAFLSKCQPSMLKRKENSGVTVTQVEPDIGEWQWPRVDIVIATCTVECQDKFEPHVVLQLNFSHFLLWFWGW